MLAALYATPLPELASWLLVGGIPLALGLLAWPLLGTRAKSELVASVGDLDDWESSGRLGLPGQWLAQSRLLEAGLDRQRAALRLHRTAAAHLGAVDHEIDRLWRDTRAVLAAGPAAT